MKYLLLFFFISLSLITHAQEKPVHDNSLATPSQQFSSTIKNDLSKKKKISQTENTQPKEFIETESGLQYMVISPGAGAFPQEDDLARVLYRMSLQTGEKIESTDSHGKAVRMSIKNQVPGLREGLQLMRVGGEYKFIIPPQLGYGAQSFGPAIPPDSTLFYYIKLVGIDNSQSEPMLPVEEILPAIILTDPESAAGSLLMIYTSIRPSYTEKDMERTCSAMALEQFDKQCREILANRLDYIKKSSIQAANFTDKNLKKLPTKGTVFEIHWNDNFKHNNGESSRTQQVLVTHLAQSDSYWKIKEINFSQ